MKTAGLILAGFLLICLLIGTLRALFDKRAPFIRPLEDGTRSAFIVLGAAALLLLAINLVDLHRVQSIELAGGKVTLAQVNQKVEGVTQTVQGVTQRVETLASEIETFYESERMEIFDKRNWNRIRVHQKKPDHSFILEVTLNEVPIPKSILVMEGVLPMPRQLYEVAGRRLRFPANSDQPFYEVITITYHVRASPPLQGTPVPTPQ